MSGLIWYVMVGSCSWFSLRHGCLSCNVVNANTYNRRKNVNKLKHSEREILSEKEIIQC